MKATTHTLWTFVVTTIALFMVVLDNLVVSTAIPAIRVDLGASLEQLEWTVNAYTLAFAVFLLTGAALGDRFGRKRMFIARGRHLHRRVRGRRAGAVRRLADRRSRGAGPRRGHRDAAHADDSQRRRLPRTSRSRARRLVRHCRPRRRHGPARRRCRRRRHRLAVDLLAERPGRPRAAPARDPAARVARARQGPRPARPRPRERGDARARLGRHPRER